MYIVSTCQQGYGLGPHQCEYTRIRGVSNPEREGPVLLCALRREGETGCAQAVEGLLGSSSRALLRSICDRRPGSWQ